MEEYQNKLTRLKKTFSCIEPDRVPLFDLFWQEFVDKWQKEKNLKTGTNIYEYYDMDLILAAPLTDPKINSYKAIEKGQNYEIFQSGFGCVLKKVDYSPMPQYLDFSVRSADDYANFSLEDPNDERRYNGECASIINGTGNVYLQSFSSILESRKNKIPVMGIVCEGHEKLWRIRGPEGVFMDLATEKEKVKKFLKRLEEFEIQIGINQIKMGADFIFVAGDVAYDKGLYFSPVTWREVFKPFLYNMCAAFKKASPEIKLVYHCCGNALAIFDDLIECGIDAYHSLEVKAGIDVLELKKKYKNKLAYIGNIDCRDTFPSSKNKIKNELLTKLNAAKGGGYIPSADHSVPLDTPVENYDYFIELLKKYGAYPLNLEEYDLKEFG